MKVAITRYSDTEKFYGMQLRVNSEFDGSTLYRAVIRLRKSDRRLRVKLFYPGTPERPNEDNPAVVTGDTAVDLLKSIGINV